MAVYSFRPWKRRAVTRYLVIDIDRINRLANQCFAIWCVYAQLIKRRYETEVNQSSLLVAQFFKVQACNVVLLILLTTWPACGVYRPGKSNLFSRTCFSNHIYLQNTPHCSSSGTVREHLHKWLRIHTGCTRFTYLWMNYIFKIVFKFNMLGNL
jgi:hypothetical protein